MLAKSQSEMISPSQVIEIIFRRRWCILPPLLLALTVGIYLAITLPKVYQAETLILVEAQQVPANFVRSIVTTDMESRINTISEQILSRTNLEAIINQFQLFDQANQTHAYMEDKVAAMRGSISIGVSKGRRQANAFTIAFKGHDPQQVAKVTNALASAFIDENMKVRESQAIGTSDFLEAELDTMRRRLEEQEKILMEYRQRHMGELPGQLNSNLSILDGLHKRLGDRQASLRAAKERLATLRDQVALAPAPTAGPGEQTMNLPELRAELLRLEARYTEKHPDIVRIKGMIAELEQKAASLGASGDSANPESFGPLADLNREIRVLESDIASLQGQIRMYESRVETIPQREQELVAIQRDYDNIRGSYQRLLDRKLEAEVSLSMERKQKGEQFRVLDFARTPNRPVEPNMKKIFVFCLAAGFAFAGALVVALEFLNNSLRAPEDMERNLGLPVLATIPVLDSPRRQVLRWLNTGLTSVSVLACVLLLAVFSTLVLYGVEPTLGLLKNLV